MSYTEIGRIRPRPMGEWAVEKEYEVLDVVMQPDGASAFMAVQNVPAGIALAQSDYWMPIVDINAAVDAAKEATDAAQRAAAQVKEDVDQIKYDINNYNNKYKTNILDINNIVVDKFVHIGGEGSATGWRHTDYIEAEYGDRIIMGASNGQNLCIFVCYDADKNILGEVFSLNGVEEKGDNYVTFINTRYIRCNIVPDFLLPISDNYIYLEKSSLYLDRIKQYTENTLYMNHSKFGLFDISSVKPPYDDLDTLPLYEIVCYGSSIIYNNGINNYPLKFTNGFTIVTFASEANNYSGSVQMAFSLIDSEIATRIYTNKWSEWIYCASTNYVEEIKSEISKVYYVGSTRTGANTFKTLRECTEFIANNSVQNATVYVDAENFDLVTEYGQTYLDSIQSTSNKGFGLRVGNNTHFIFAEGSKVVFNYEGTNSDCAEFFSPFNVIGSVTLENANIEVSNARYCVHEDLPTSSDTIPDNTIVKYINCFMNHKGDTIPSGSHSGYSCIGGGTNKNTLSILKGGKYKAAWEAPVSYHNYYGNLPSKIILENVWMDKALRLADFGTNEVEVQITGCYIPNGIIGTHTYFTITEWNNSFSN